MLYRLLILAGFWIFGLCCGFSFSVYRLQQERATTLRCVDVAEDCDDKLKEALRAVDKCGAAIHTFDAIEKFYCAKSKQKKNQPDCRSPLNWLATQG